MNLSPCSYPAPAFTQICKGPNEERIKIGTKKIKFSNAIGTFIINHKDCKYISILMNSSMQKVS